MALIAFGIVAAMFTQSCKAMNYYTVEIRNISPRLTKETSVQYGKYGVVNVGYLDVGPTPSGAPSGKGECTDFGPTPDEAVVSWVEKNGKKYEVKVKVYEAVKTRKPDGNVIFTIQPDRSVKVSYEPTDPRLKAFEKWQRGH